MNPALFIDGRNHAYRSVFAARGPQFSSTGGHPLVMWLKLAHMWLEKWKPSSVHVFWDCPKNSVWRKKLFPEYKDNRDGMTHVQDPAIKEALIALEGAAHDILPLINVRNYNRDAQEADDLIYAACRVIAPTPVIIISSDSDMIQMPWFMHHVKCYEPRKNEFVPLPDTNPTMQKALMGDSADNVIGYRGIGPVKSRELINDWKALAEFLVIRGDREFKTNMALVDLSLNPSRLSNELHIIRTMAQPTVYDKAAIYEQVMKHKVRGLNAELPKILSSFKRLGLDGDQT